MRHHDILGVSLNASTKDIRRAYRQAAKETHPDTGSSDTEEFKKLHEAYTALLEEKRSKESQQISDNQPPVDLDDALQKAWTAATTAPDPSPQQPAAQATDTPISDEEQEEIELDKKALSYTKTDILLHMLGKLVGTNKQDTTALLHRKRLKNSIKRLNGRY